MANELPQDWTILALETSCDETAAAVIRGGRMVISNEVASQMHLHERYGGVVPEVASREHILSMTPVIEAALAPLPGGWDEVDAIACTQGPGLAGALLTGVNAAKGLAWSRRKPLVAVNHLEGHIYANWLRSVDGSQGGQDDPPFPLVCLIVSGGHTTLVLLRDHGDYQLLGQTRDDAAGEAFDKAVRIMGLGYPGGPRVEQVARGVDPGDVRVPRAWLGDSYDFSFSGVKTHVLHAMEAHNAGQRDEHYTARLAAAFQEAVVDVLSAKTVRAATDFGARCVLLAGGVAANGPLRQALIARSPVPVRYPPIRYCTDNAAMIGAAAFFRYEQGLQQGWTLSIKPNLKVV
jgi:N6-L-threonylcarbamoyladenine synthase